MSITERRPAEGAPVLAPDPVSEPVRGARRGRIWKRGGLALVVVLGAGLWLGRGVLFPEAAPVVMTAPVVRGTVEETVLATGILKPSGLVAVGAQVSGRITKLAVELGQVVKAGDLVAEIDSIPQRNALRTAEATLAAVQAQRVERRATLTQQERVLARQRVLAETSAISQSTLETAEADVAVTQAQIEALDAQIEAAKVGVETAQVDLGYTRITAPSDGTILAVVAQEGQTVNAVQSTPTIVVLGALDEMIIQAEISEADVVRVTPGQKVWFTILGEPRKRYEAALASIAPAPVSITNDSALSGSSNSTTTTTSTEAIYYNGKFVVPNPDGRLRSYMTAQVHIVLGTAENALTVPSAALGAENPDGTRAARVQGADGVIETRAVTVGLNDRTVAEVRAGLAEGEKVVTGDGTAATASPPGGPPPPGF